ncbi:MAG: T9SS type A sorting domain-containing protein [Candidatus Latescibacteria bacterium]|nr:T9SS type A sorting domain-containing protein [Candidatus Latescibacterota bacterium]
MTKYRFSPPVLWALLLIGSASAQPDTWSWVGAPPGGLISTLAVDPLRPQLVYAGSQRGNLFWSDDGGRTWTRSNGPGGDILDLTVDPSDPDGIYCIAAVEEGTALFKSGDRGTRWTLLTRGVRTLAVAPTNLAVLYTDALGSSNGGDTWRPLARPPLFDPDDDPPALGVHPQAAGTLFWGTPRRGYRSLDGGRTWDQVIPRGVADFAFAADGAIYAATRDKGVYRSDDGGDTWSIEIRGFTYETGVNPAIRTRALLAVAVVPGSSEELFAGTEGGLFKSANQGRSWGYTGPDLQQTTSSQYIVDLAVLDRQRIIARLATGASPQARQGALATTEDGGATWRFAAPDLLRQGHGRIWARGPNPEGGLLLYGGNSWGLYKSADWGRTWTELRRGDMRGAAVDPHDARRVFAHGILVSGFEGKKWVYRAVEAPLWRSDDAGGTWERTATPAQGYKVLRVHPGRPERLYSTGRDGGYHISNDSGDSWKWHFVGGTNSLDRLTINPHRLEHFIAQTSNNHIYQSLDGGLNWERLLWGSANPFAVAWSPSKPLLAYAGFADRNDSFPQGAAFIQRSSDGGETWESMDSFVGVNSVEHLAVHPTQPHLLAAGTWQGVRLSNDGGHLWDPLGELDERIADLFFSPEDAHPLYASTEEGLYRWAFTHQPDAPPEITYPTTDLATLPPQGTWQYHPVEGGVTAFAFDRVGGIWFVGRKQLGHLEADGTIQYQPDPGTDSCFDPHLHVDTLDRVWYSLGSCGVSVSFGLFRLDGDGPTSFGEEIIDNFPGYSVNISTVLPRADGSIWMGTISYDRWGGLFRLDGQQSGSRVTHDNLFNDDNINVIAEDENGTLWVGTGGDITHSTDHFGGLSAFDGTTWTYYGLREGLGDAFVLDLAFARDGSIWVGTYNGLTHFAEGRGTNYQLDTSTLPSTRVPSVAIDSRGAVWAGTPAGLSRFDGTHWTTYTTADGLPHDYIVQVEVDSSDRIWVATHRGLAELDYYGTDTAVAATALPPAFALEQNFPNPFNSDTNIGFALPQASHIDLGLYNLAGQRLATLAQGRRPAGSHTLSWDGRLQDRTLASGVYLYRLSVEGQVTTRKLLLLR